MPNPENLIGKGFESRPQDINKDGRPRKSFSTINKSLQAAGVEPLTKTNLIKSYELIFSATEEELQNIAKDKETPYGLKLIIKELNNTKSRSQALKDYRDYMFGKATENKNIEVTEVVRKIGYGDSDTP
jgi:hypothetical protein